MSRIFYSYGKFCASRPWEVMISFLTFSICLFSLGGIQTNLNDKSNLNTSQNPNIYNTCIKDSTNCNSEEESIDAIYIITIARCLSMLYIYHQFRNLYKLGSKYLTRIAGLFSVFSSFFFCTSVINFLNGDFSKLNKALPFFCLLLDLPKAVLLAQFALSSSKKQDIRENIAQGMVILGPTLTLDTLLELLSIGMGTISGVGKMEELIYFACLSVIVNYIILMTFFPACLSLALELSHNRDGDKPSWQLSSLSKVLQIETERATNPVIQRVKLIMSAGLMLVHIISRWPITELNENISSNSSSNTLNQIKLVTTPNILKVSKQNKHIDISIFEHYLRKWFAVSLEQFVMFGLVFALIIKYIYDSKENLEEEVRAHQQSNVTITKDNLNEKLSNKTYKVFENNQQPNRTSSSPAILTLNDQISNKIDKNQIKQNKEILDLNDQPSFFLGDDNTNDDNILDEQFDFELVDKEIQTEESNIESALKEFKTSQLEIRDITVLQELLLSEDGVKQLTDLEVIFLVEKRKIPSYKLESILGDPERGVKIRRMLLSNELKAWDIVNNIPFTKYNYSLVMGACCENVIGYCPVPMGIAGPLYLDGEKYQVPMATTEGCLIASTNRGCRALALSGGIRSNILKDLMTRGPVVKLPYTSRVLEVRTWIENNFGIIKEAFDSSSRFARLEQILPASAGNYLYLRFGAKTGDAMGMNMISKGTELALKKINEYFPDMEIISLSGNFCCDKKPSAINWIFGRGKSVICEARVPSKVVNEVLKTDVKSLIELNLCKNLVGSAIAGSIGGFNAHAANVVAAIYIACGQDPAQVVESSNCMTLLELCKENPEDLVITCTMPSLEVGTIGGGTILTAQSSCLDILRVKGSCIEKPGRNAQKFASIVCATVLASELSLLSALAAGHLVKSHMKHNRSSVSINASPSHSLNNN